MNVIRFFIPGSFENYNHLLVCPETGEAMVVDPFDATLVREQLMAVDAQLTGILLTHEHGDHTRGVAELLAEQPLPIWGHSAISCVDQPLTEGQTIAVGQQQVTAWFTPGHTHQHFCFLGEDSAHVPYLICADTLFNAGVGNCRSGNVDDLFHSVTRCKADLAPNTHLYPAHDYLCNNSKFALTLEPSNRELQATLDDNVRLEPEQRQITTWQLELAINPFLRLDSVELKTHVAQKTGASVETPLQVFRALRALRDSW